MTLAVNIAQSGSNNQTFRNRIINGAMTIDQRNAGASKTIIGGEFTLDRWEPEVSQSSKFSVQQQTSVVPAGFTYAMAITSLSAYSVGSSEVFGFRQIIEGFNTADLGWGTANAQPVTLSFWVRSSLTGTFGGALNNGDNNRSYPFAYTISSANTWEYKTITAPGDTTGTWGTTNGRGIQVRFGLGMGSTFSGTAGVWAAADYRTATGATSVVGTNGATFYITGVQLEEGTAASPFENRLYGTELALCQRYCLKYGGTSNNEDVNTQVIIGYNSTSAYGAIYAIVPMRATPSVSSSTMRLVDQTNSYPITSIVSSGGAYSGPYNLNCGFNVSSGIVQYRPYALIGNNNSAAYVILSAEL
jgi:hypothetical protein